MPACSCISSAKRTSSSAWAIRCGLELPWPVPSSGPEPLDLKWFTTTRNREYAEPPTGSKAWASGSRATSKTGTSSITDSPTGSTTEVR